MKMKAAVYYGLRDIRVEEIDVPPLEATDVLVKVKASGICGSDLHGYRKGLYVRPGWVMGHEYSGEVVEVGSKVEDIKVGDQVVPHGRVHEEACGQCYWCSKGQPQWCASLARRPCGKCEYCTSGQFFLCTELARSQAIGYGRYGAYAEYVRVVDATLGQNIFRLPDELSYEEGAIVEPLSGSIWWAGLGEPKAGDMAVVLGAGTIGLCVMQFLKQLVSKVIVTEVSERRLAAARELGADVVINAAKEDALQRVVEETGVGRSYSGRGGAIADIVVDCAGTPITFQQSLEMARSGGRIVLVALYEEPVMINPTTIVLKDLRIISSYAGRVQETHSQMAEAIELMRKGEIKGKPLVSHEFPLEKIMEAFETQVNTNESIKVLVKP